MSEDKEEPRTLLSLASQQNKVHGPPSWGVKTSKNTKATPKGSLGIGTGRQCKQCGKWNFTGYSSKIDTEHARN